MVKHHNFFQLKIMNFWACDHYVHCGRLKRECVYETQSVLVSIAARRWSDSALSGILLLAISQILPVMNSAWFIYQFIIQRLLGNWLSQLTLKAMARLCQFGL